MRIENVKFKLQGYMKYCLSVVFLLEEILCKVFYIYNWFLNISRFLERFFEQGIFGLPGGIQVFCVCVCVCVCVALEPKSGVVRLFDKLYRSQTHPHTHIR